MAEFINRDDSLNQGREKLNKSIQDAEDAKVTAQDADEKADQALSNSEDTQNQLDQVVIEGDSSVEAAQARIDAKGNSHETLKQRLDNDYNQTHQKIDSNHDEVTSQLAQNMRHLRTNVQVFPKSKVKMVAHRGYSFAAPENTLPAYELAGKLGFWGGEADIRCTSDGEWVLMHDHTVDRTTDGTGIVESMTLSEIKNLTIDAGKNIDRHPNLKVPTFSEFLLCCKENDLVPLVEVKSALEYSNIDGLINQVYKYGFERSIIFMSFVAEVTQEIRNKDKYIRLYHILDGQITQSVVDTALSFGAFGISTGSPTEEGVSLANQNGLEVNVWTINDMTNAIQYKNWNVDSISTDKLSEVTI